MDQARFKRVLGKDLRNDKQEEGKYYIFDNRSAFSVNEIGARIFELCDGSNNIQSICEKLMTIYDIDFETLRNDVSDLLVLMVENRIVKEIQ